MGEVVEIAVSKIKPIDNTRGHIDSTDLQLSISKVGLLRPLIVEPMDADGMYPLRAGYRRFAAVKALGWESVGCEFTDDEEALAVQLADNVHADADILKEAELMRRLVVEKKWTDRKAASAMGLTLPQMKVRIDLLNAAPEVQEAVRSGRMSLSAFESLRKEPKDRQSVVVAGVRSKGKAKKITRRAVRLSMKRVDEGQQPTAIDVKCNSVRHLAAAHEKVFTALAEHANGQDYDKEEVAWLERIMDLIAHALGIETLAVDSDDIKRLEKQVLGE